MQTQFDRQTLSNSVKPSDPLSAHLNPRWAFLRYMGYEVREFLDVTLFPESPSDRCSDLIMQTALSSLTVQPSGLYRS